METQEQVVTAAPQQVEAVETVGKLGQKDAVYLFVNQALNAPDLAPGTKLKELVTKEVRKVVRQRLFAAVRSGEMKFSKQYDDSRLKKYCSGLINNWLKKDPRFN
jgi:hypothetical protein